MAVTVAVETPLQDDVRELVTLLNEHLLPLSPVEFQWKMTVDEMAGPETTVFVARDEARRAVGCGALKLADNGLAEVKRMFTRPDVRGQRVGTALLNAIEALARQKGVATLLLETGTGPGFAGAFRLYENSGFTECGAFFDYPESEWSRFYEKRLVAQVDFRIEQELPRRPDIAAMIAELDQFVADLVPGVEYERPDAEALAHPSVTVFVARSPQGEALGMGALRRDADGVAELKRMFTRPAARGKNIGGMILDRIIELARREGLKALVLETGQLQGSARRLYESRGFTQRGPIFGYPDNGDSVFYEKSLQQPAVA